MTNHIRVKLHDQSLMKRSRYTVCKDDCDTFSNSPKGLTSRDIENETIINKLDLLEQLSQLSLHTVQSV